MVRAAFVAVGALALAGCVTTSSSMIGSDTAIISAKGKGWGESNASLMQHAMLEAAKIGAKRGFDYFIITDSQDTTTQQTAYMPGNVTSNTYGQANCYGYSCYGSATTNSFGYGPHYVNIVRAGQDVYVHFYHLGQQPQGAIGVAETLATK